MNNIELMNLAGQKFLLSTAEEIEKHMRDLQANEFAETFTQMVNQNILRSTDDEASADRLTKIWDWNVAQIEDFNKKGELLQLVYRLQSIADQEISPDQQH